MNIIQIAPYYPPYLGGQERFLLHLTRHMAEQGHAVTVLTTRHLPSLPWESEEGGVQIRRYPCLAKPFRNPITPGLLFAGKVVADADVLHAHNEHSFAANAAVWLARRQRKPLVLTVHGRLILDSRIGQLVLHGYERTISRIVFRTCNRITTAWAAEKDRLCTEYHIPEEKISVIPYGIDIGYWQSFRDRPGQQYAWREQIARRKVILVATQLIKRKGINYMIRAMPRILASEPNALLLIAGSGDQEAALRALAQDLSLANRVLFLGRLFDEELSAAHRVADVFVLPSLSEGLPVCLMEAWAHDNPVVATRIDGTKDDFQDIADLVNPADPEDLANAILRVLRDPAYAKRRGTEGRRRIETDYSWPAMAARMTAEYEKAIAGSGSGGR